MFLLVDALPGVPVPDHFASGEVHPDTLDMDRLFSAVCHKPVSHVPEMHRINNPAEVCEGKWIDMHKVTLNALQMKKQV
jgi:hypothetical protein